MFYGVCVNLLWHNLWPFAARILWIFKQIPFVYLEYLQIKNRAFFGYYNAHIFAVFRRNGSTDALRFNLRSIIKISSVEEITFVFGFVVFVLFIHFTYMWWFKNIFFLSKTSIIVHIKTPSYRRSVNTGAKL